jgi:hypothetical protein
VPEPFFGPFEAPAVVLLLNPGVSREDAKAHVSPKLQRLLLENLHRNDSEMPHVHLTPGASHPGAKWWTTAVSGLPDSARTHVARSLLAVQYFRITRSLSRTGQFAYPLRSLGLLWFAMPCRALRLSYWHGVAITGWVRFPSSTLILDG